MDDIYEVQIRYTGPADNPNPWKPYASGLTLLAAAKDYADMARNSAHLPVTIEVRILRYVAEVVSQ